MQKKSPLPGDPIKSLGQRTMDSLNITICRSQICNRNTIRNQQHIHGSSRTSNTERKPNLVCLTNNRVTNSTQTSPASSNITAKVHEIRSISVRTYCINLHSFFKVIEFVLTCILYFVRKKCEKKINQLRIPHI